jgi:hypothetical protein
MQKFDDSIGFWEKANFFAENCRKSQKITITTSTPRGQIFNRFSRLQEIKCQNAVFQNG